MWVNKNNFLTIVFCGDLKLNDENVARAEKRRFIKSVFTTQLRVRGRQEGGDHRIQQAVRRRERRHVDARILFVGPRRRQLHRQLGGRRERIPTRRSSPARRSRRLSPSSFRSCMSAQTNNKKANSSVYVWPRYNILKI